MVVKTGPELKLGKSEEGCALGEETVTNVEVPIKISEQNGKNGVLQDGKGIEKAPFSRGDEEDVHINITGNGRVGSGFKGLDDACVVLTETEGSSSSSFGDTGSGLDTASGSAFSDSDVQSAMCDDWTESQPPHLRNKKVTAHWRRFSSPLMWRCKWLELQLGKLNSQAMKYEKELAAYDYKKQLEFLKFAVDGFDAKSVPRSDGIQRNKVMKRKKRRRAEEFDLSSYMSSHSVFSYYETKSHSPDACLENFRSDVSSIADNTEEIKLNNMWTSVDHEDNDKSLIDMIQEIEGLLSHVEKLKTRVHKISENSGKFGSVSQLSITGQSGGFNHSGHNSASLTGNENTLSTREGITPFIETTNRPQLDFPQENSKDEFLMQNQARGGGVLEFENVRNQLVENSKDSVEEQQSISPAQVSDSDLVPENAIPKICSTFKACSTSKSNIPMCARSRRKKSNPRC